MALTLANRVRETTTTTGTGTVTLAGAVTGYQAFSVIGNANTTYYTISGQGTSEFEVGIGTYTLSGTTLSRDTVLASSNGGSLVNFSAGTKDAFVTYPSNKAVYLDASSNVTLPGTLVGPATATVFNTVSTTVNAFGAASTALNMGHASGTNTVLGNTVLTGTGGDNITASILSVKATTGSNGTQIRFTANDTAAYILSEATTAFKPLKIFVNNAEAIGIATSGAVSIPGTLAAGNTTITGAATISTTLGVTGATTLSSTLGVTGATTLSSTLAAGNTTITGTLSASGVFTSTATGNLLLATAAGTGFKAVNLSNTSGNAYFGVEGSPGGQLYGTAYATMILAAAGKNIESVVGSSIITTVASTGLAVTGTLSATSTLSTTGGAAKAEAAASQAKSTVGAFNSGAAVTASAEILTFAQAGTQRISHFWAQNSLRYQIQTLTAGHTIALSPDTGNTDVLVASSTGVAVTGTLSATTGAAVGGATAGAGGVAFPATAVAVADANTLDDYEEGTWTPSIGGNATYTTQSGIYTRIGNQVTVGWEIEISVKGTGSATIMSGLPFTNRNGYYPTASLSYWGNLGSSVTFLGGQVQPNGTTMNFTSGNASSATCSSPTTVFANSTRVMGSVTYIV